MPVAAGSYEIGPKTGRLLLRTFRQGLAARAGYDLLIEAASWQGQISVPADRTVEPSVSVRVDMNQLHVLEGTGGLKPLSEGDKTQVKDAMRKVLQTDRYPEATFRSTSVRIDDDIATVEGELTLVGQSHVLLLEVHQRDDGVVAGTTSVVQSSWGIKPYVGLLGALRLRDAVDVEFTVDLPGS